MNVIRVLSTEVANRIAAGEVVERPASVLKELFENALDAGAQHIEVVLEGGGVKLLRVTDDGCGMSPEDLALCVLPHATSKIADVDDLFRVASFGFRGEALPSIGAVSDVEITSRVAGGEAHALRVHDGQSDGPRPAAGAIGTSVCVRDLFSRLPARLRFLKQERTELAHCVDTMVRLMLPDNSVSARMLHEGRTVLDIRGSTDRRQRIAALLSEDVARNLMEVRAGGPELSVEAWISPCDLVRRTAEQQHVFLNGRCIRDRNIAFAIRDAYRGLIMPKEHAIVLLFISVDPAQVDVNVHPQKSEVRFRNRDAVVGLVRSALRRRLLEAPGERNLNLPSAVVAPTAEVAKIQFAPESSALRSSGVVNYTAHTSTSPAAPVVHETAQSWTARPDHRQVVLESERSTTRGSHRCNALAQGPTRGTADLPGTETQGPHRFLQVHRAWIVLESPTGLTVLDQHALHERWLYEDILRRFESAECESQTLLVPEQVAVTPIEIASLLEHAALLARLGLQVEAFGPTTILVRAMPLALRRATSAELVEDALRVIETDGGASADSSLVTSLAADLACRAAVRFGDRLPDVEVAALLEWWQRHPLLRNCPHGRPVAASVSLQELELQFLRKK